MPHAVIDKFVLKSQWLHKQALHIVSPSTHKREPKWFKYGFESLAHTSTQSLFVIGNCPKLKQHRHTLIEYRLSPEGRAKSSRRLSFLVFASVHAAHANTSGPDQYIMICLPTFWLNVFENGLLKMAPYSQLARAVAQNRTRVQH